ncbi:SpaN/EivJ family type III secretion system needle length determinant [Escherichia coli]
MPENELTYQFQRWGQNHTVDSERGRDKKHNPTEPKQ